MSKRNNEPTVDQIFASQSWRAFDRDGLVVLG